MTQRMILTQKEMVCIDIVAFDKNLFSHVVVNYLVFQPFRKKLFSRGVGLLATGAWLQNTVSYWHGLNLCLSLCNYVPGIF